MQTIKVARRGLAPGSPGFPVVFPGLFPPVRMTGTGNSENVMPASSHVEGSLADQSCEAHHQQPCQFASGRPILLDSLV